MIKNTLNPMKPQHAESLSHSRRRFLVDMLRGLAAAGLSGLAPLAWPAANTPAGHDDKFKAWRQRQTRPAVDETDPNLFNLARLKYIPRGAVRASWDDCLYGDENILAWLRAATNLKISNRSFTERVVSLDDAERLGRSPLLLMTGQGDFTFSARQSAALGEYLLRGGFLIADTACRLGEDFHNAFIRELPKTIPGTSLLQVPGDHEMFHNGFYIDIEMDRMLQGIAHPPLGLFHRNRMVAMLTGEGYLRTCAGLDQTWPQAEPAFKMLTNIIIYALTH